MSEQNVELVRRVLGWLPDLRDAAPGEDQARIGGAFRDYLDDDFELRIATDYPEGAPIFRGREGIFRMAAWLRDAWSEWRIEPQRFIDAGDQVVVFARIVGKGRASGVPFELKIAYVVTVQHDRLSSMSAYQDRSDALRAAGLEA